MSDLSQSARDGLAQEMGSAYVEVQRLKDARTRANADLTKAQERLRGLHQALADGGAPEVSDHAVLRYAERVLGMNPEEIRAAILTQILPVANRLGDGRYPVGHGCVAVIVNKVVVSVVPV